MFDYTLLHWGTFLLTALLLNLSPGPDIAFILGHTLRGGRRSGFAALSGIWCGAAIHVVLAAAGLSAIVMTSAVAFSVVKWVGVAYLMYLGVRALMSSGGGMAMASSRPDALAAVTIWRQGLMVSVLNPKVAIFFLALLPQFVVAGAGPVWAQLALHGVVIIAVAALVEPPLILVADRLARGLTARPEINRWLDRTLGGIFVALGIRLALEQR